MEKKDITLLIMAGGLGSRFGGLKQIEPIGPNNEFITDYSIYDAMLAGFKKVIFIIKQENLEIFKNTIEARINNKVEIDYVFQGKDLICGDEVFARDKPWGTAHAIYQAKDKIDGNFIIINSDDFYGRDAYFVAHDFLNKELKYNEFALVGYQSINTLTENGAVKRGVCKVSNDFLTDIIESNVEMVDGKIVASPLNGEESFEIPDTTLVSMNMFLFTPYIFEIIESYLNDFIMQNQNNLESCEYLIPDVVKRAVLDKKVTVEVLKTTAKWEGVTYKEDKEKVVTSIRNLIDDGIYKRDLWQK